MKNQLTAIWTHQGEEKSSKEDNIQSHIQHVFALVDSSLNKDEIKFDPKANEEQYCDEYDEALNDNKIVGVVVAEPTQQEIQECNHTTTWRA